MTPMETYRKLHEDSSSGFGVDAVTLDVPLLIRIMEVCREDIKDDKEIHQFATQIVALKDRGVLGIKDWDDMCTCGDNDDPVSESVLDEKIKLKTKVTMHHPGKDYHGKTGHVGEIRHGAHRSAPKTYTVDYDNGKSVQLDKSHIKVHKEEVDL
jgi:hypothetical protein